MGNRIFNVKQAAKILGLSTNTTYKYLNEGRIKAARGHIRGTFIITTKSLEDFLGTKLPENIADSPEIQSQSSINQDSEAIIEVSPPSLSTKVTRTLLIIALLLMILDIATSKQFTPLLHLTRLGFVLALILVSYQSGGFVKK